MVWFKRLGKLAETVNTYYEFALLALAVVLYITRHSRIAEWLALFAIPILAGWAGYLLRARSERQDRKEGFRLVANSMMYEIGKDGHYTLRYHTKLKAFSDHSMVYPIGYQWTGVGEEGVPKIATAGQQLLAPVPHAGRMKAAPYESKTVSADDHWHYWFVAFNPPIDAGESTEIEYSQTFHDKEGMAKPYLYYFVRVPMDHLELRVKFPAHARPVKVAGSYIKPSNPMRAQPSTGVHYDPEGQLATWIIEKPKKGYCYRIHWQYTI